MILTASDNVSRLWQLMHAYYCTDSTDSAFGVNKAMGNSFSTSPASRERFPAPGVVSEVRAVKTWRQEAGDSRGNSSLVSLQNCRCADGSKLWGRSATHLGIT